MYFSRSTFGKSCNVNLMNVSPVGPQLFIRRDVGTDGHEYMLYAFFWVIPRRLNFICRRFGTLCLFHLHRQVGARPYLPMKMEQSVPKRRHIKFRHRGITQKKAYNIQDTTKKFEIKNDEDSRFLQF